jgi:acetyl-CoA carboxylase carboxyl transferase subunit alpha
VDEIIPETKGGAHNDPDGAAVNLKAALVRHLSQLEHLSEIEILEQRADRFRKLGVFEELA